MKFKRIIIVILSILLLIIAVFLIAHINPSMSIRTYVFINGHPIGAFKGTVQTNELEYKLDKDILDKENAMIYDIKGYAVYSKYGMQIENYKVKKRGFLYYADSYGGG
ncbi:MAG: hypothetical protein H7Y18_05790 [Clostridiaceae bacterium]|nr:hypothetical protein [Clostridiaceae bacterium]